MDNDNTPRYVVTGLLSGINSPVSCSNKNLYQKMTTHEMDETFKKVTITGEIKVNEKNFVSVKELKDVPAWHFGPSPLPGWHFCIRRDDKTLLHVETKTITFL